MTAVGSEETLKLFQGGEITNIIPRITILLSKFQVINVKLLYFPVAHH